MKLAIEPFTSLSGWTLSGGITAPLLNQHRDYIADGLASSVAFHIPAGSSGQTIRKTIAVDATGYDEVVLSAWSRRRSSSVYRAPSDFSYKIAFEATREFYLPVFPSFVDITIALRGLVALTQVQVTVLHNDEDDLLLSGCYAIQDEYPLDIMEALRAGLAAEVASRYGNGIAIGTVTARKNEERIVVDGARDFLDRYSVIRFGSESHQVDLIDETGLTFMSTYDGKKVLANQTQAAVYLQMPVVYGTTEKEAALPGIALWGMSPEPVARSTGVERWTDTYEVGGNFSDQRQHQILSYQFLIDAEARHWEILAGLNKVVRRMLGRNYLWINGRKHDFEWDLAPTDVEPEMPVETLPKTQYMLALEVREPREDRALQVAAGPGNLNIQVMPPGVLGVGITPQVPLDGLEAYYPFDLGSVLDFSGNNRNLESLAAVGWADGISGLGLSFVDRSIIRYARSATIDFSAKAAYSLSFWVSKTVPANNNNRIVSWALSNANGIYIYCPTGTDSIVLYFNRAGGSEARTIVNMLSTGLWHVTLTFDLATKAWVLYRNGGFADGGTLGSTPVMPNQTFALGNDNVTPVTSIGWVGVVDEVRLYSRVLTAAEVAAIYAADQI